jgi:hypothetical protein
MNYAALVQAIQDYTQNSETSFVANIPLFVEQAEERINRSIMIPELRKNVTANMMRVTSMSPDQRTSYLLFLLRL